MDAASDESLDVDSAGVYFVSVEEFEQRKPSDRGTTPLTERGAEPLTERGAEPLAECGAKPLANRRPIKTLREPT